MAQETITLDDRLRRFPHPDMPNDDLGEAFDKVNANFTELYTADGQSVKLTGNQTIGGVKTFSSTPVLPADNPPLTLFSSTVTISNAQMLALNATPIDIIAAPAAGVAIIVERAEFLYTFATAAFAGIATNEDLALRYTNGSGTILLTQETTGFLDQASNQYRVANPDNNVTPTAAAKVVLHMTTGEIITGGGNLKVRVWYRLITLLT